MSDTLFDLRKTVHQSTLDNLLADADYDSTSSDDLLESNLLIITDETPDKQENSDFVASVKYQQVDLFQFPVEMKQSNSDQVSSHGDPIILQTDAVKQTTKVREFHFEETADRSLNQLAGEDQSLHLPAGESDKLFSKSDQKKCKSEDLGQNEIEKLQQIFAEITSIRQKHNELIAENSDNKERYQEIIEKEKKELEQLEQQHRETGQMMKTAASGSDEQKSWMLKYRNEQDELEQSRRHLDDLEFQLLESEAFYEEQKEQIQEQLVVEQKKLTQIYRQHQADDPDRRSSCGSDMQLKIYEPLIETTDDNSEPGKCNSGKPLTNENYLTLMKDLLTSSVVPSNNNNRLSDTLPDAIKIRLENLERGGNEVIEEERSRLKLLRNEAALEVKLAWGKDRRPAHLTAIGQTDFTELYLAEPGAETAEETSGNSGEIGIEHLYSGSNYDKSQVMDKHNWDSSAQPDVNMSFESDVTDGSNSAASSSTDQQQEKGEQTQNGEDQLMKMRMLLVAAEAEKNRLLQLQKQHIMDMEELKLEKEARLRLERQLSLEISRRNELIEEKVKLREKHRFQARPLTRYLPVREGDFDLSQFIEQAGHNLELCPHISLSASSASGFLTKMGGRIKTWHRRWFVFDRRKRQLIYYTDKSEQTMRGYVNFQTIEDVFVDNVHTVKSPSPKLTFCVKTPKRTYYMVAPSTEARQIWIDVIFTGAEGYQEFSEV